MRCEILGEALWILNNLTHEPRVSFDETLFCDFNIKQILQAHLLDIYIEDMGDSAKGSFSEAQLAKQDHYPAVTPLRDYELHLLKEILWLLSNLANHDSIAFAFASDRFPEQLYLISRNFHNQFDFDHWRVILWNFRMVSATLHMKKRGEVDISPYYNFLAAFNE